MQDLALRGLLAWTPCIKLCGPNRIEWIPPAQVKLSDLGYIFLSDASLYFIFYLNSFIRCFNEWLPSEIGVTHSFSLLGVAVKGSGKTVQC